MLNFNSVTCNIIDACTQMHKIMLFYKIINIIGLYVEIVKTGYCFSLIGSLKIAFYLIA